MIEYQLTKMSFNKRKTRGTWTFDRPDKKGPIKIYARCGSCARLNDLSTGFFTAKFENGKSVAGVSGCQACKFCIFSFNGSLFHRLPTMACFVYNGENYFSEHLKELSRIFAKTKETFYAYAVNDAVSPYMGLTQLPMTGRMVNLFYRKRDNVFEVGSPLYTGQRKFDKLEDVVGHALEWVTTAPKAVSVAV